MLNDIKTFISLEVGESFTGIFKDYKRVPSHFSGKETIELSFVVNSMVKSLTSISLANGLVAKQIMPGQEVRITKVAKNGNQVTWLIEPLTDLPEEI